MLFVVKLGSKEVVKQPPASQWNYTDVGIPLELDFSNAFNKCRHPSSLDKVKRNFLKLFHMGCK